jgi:arylsulfatase A-like enzyme
MTKPNILIIHCHDLGQHLGCYGVPTVQTPEIDRLASEGVLFRNNFCVSPSCSPSRAAIFTGRYPHNNGVMGLCHANFAWDLYPTERHMAQYLADAEEYFRVGYRTAAVGVVHETCSGPERCGYQEYAPASRAVPAAATAVEFLRKYAGEPGRPFFLSVGFFEPHRLPYPDTDPPQEHGFCFPDFSPDDELGIQVPGYLRNTPGTLQELAELQGAIRHVDQQVGIILTALESYGLQEDTLVIFTTDHGIAMPRAKCSLYDGGIQTAFILRLPNRPGWHGGKTIYSLVSNIDMLPTILDLVGEPVPRDVQGYSLMGLLDGNEYNPRQEVFAEMTYHGHYDPQRCIRTKEAKLILNFSTAPVFQDPSQSWRPRSDTALAVNQAVAFHPDIELYDLEQDPWELENLAGKPEYQSLEIGLLQRLHRQMVVTNDPLLHGAVMNPQHSRVLRALKNTGS